jgi:hypothetical protein
MARINFSRVHNPERPPRRDGFDPLVNSIITSRKFGFAARRLRPSPAYAVGLSPTGDHGAAHTLIIVDASSDRDSIQTAPSHDRQRSVERHGTLSRERFSPLDAQRTRYTHFEFFRF